MADLATVHGHQLLLGSDAYTLVHAALADRLAAVEAQQAVAYSTDVEDDPPRTA
jgi:hypothetical protein